MQTEHEQGMGPEIRIAEEKDAESLARFLHAIYSEAAKKHNVHFSLLDESLEKLINQITLDIKTNQVLIAEQGPEIVGAITLYISPDSKHASDPPYLQSPTVGEVAHFAIRNNHRGTGLGGRMLEGIETVARQHGLEGLALVTAKGTQLETYYRKHGFTVNIGDIPMAHHPGIVLGKTLNPNSLRS